MTMLPKLFMAGLVCLAAGTAQAGMVTYRFTASIAWMNEADLGSGGFPDVDHSTLPGTLIKVGDTITGTISYDTGAALSAFQPTPFPDLRSAIYDPGAHEFITYTIDRTGYTFCSDPALRQFAYYQVSDAVANPAGVIGDSFSASMINADDSFERDVRLIVKDADGAALQDTAMPPQLDPTRFREGQLTGGFTRRRDNAWMGFDADITSLAEVPEPAVPGLLLAGAAGMAVVGRSTRHKKA